MTMLSPLGKVPKRRPPKRSGSRRPQPVLIMISVLVIIAIVVWWRAFNPSKSDNSTEACAPKPKPGVSKMDPHKVVVRVYNSTDKAGLAKKVGTDLGKRGFKIENTGNDPIKETRTVGDVGEVRFGSLGAQQAMFVSFQIPGIKLVRDQRTDAVVDVAIGPKYSRIGTPAEVQQAAQVAESNAKANEKFDSGSDC